MNPERFYNQIKSEYECPQGFDSVHGACKITRDLTRVGSTRVPSIENAAGCKKINGSWNHKYGVCIMSDGEDVGWTAPIKGAYFAWWQGHGVNAWKMADKEWNRLHSKKDLLSRTDKEWDEHLVHTLQFGEVTGCHIYSDPFYVDSLGMGMCESKFFDKAGKFQARERALQLASDVLQGKAQKYNLLYFDGDGRRAQSDRPDVMVSDDPRKVKDMLMTLKQFPAFAKKTAFRMR
jgi:hypothetical protein